MPQDVVVNISDETQPVTRAGFGKPLIFDPTQEFEYAEAEGTDGLPDSLTSGDMAYEMFSAAMSQDPSPEEVAVVGEDIEEGATAEEWEATKSYEVDDIVKPTTDNENGHYYVCTEAGTSGSDEPDWPTKDGETVEDDTVTWEETGFTSISEALDALVVEENDWYFGLVASRDQGDIEEFASWIDANNKLGASQADISEKVSDIVTMAENINSSRFALYAHDGGSANEDQYMDAAIVGKIAPKKPGAVTWKFKSLNGVAASTYLNADLSTLLDDNVNSYIKTRGVTQTNEGLATDGSFLDIQRGKDWLTARMEEAVFFLLHNEDKVPFDNPGIAQIIGEVKGTLKLGVRNRVIAKDDNDKGMWSVTPVKREDIEDNAIANREIPDIPWEATIAGAVHNVTINGVLTV